MSHANRSRKPVKPVQGICRWIRRLDHPDGAVLEINGTPYTVVVITGGYRLVKADGTTYDIDGTTWTCSCPDATWRQRECKHVKALRAASSK